MAKIPRETVDAVRERTDIAAVISRHVALTRRGRNLVGLCPFHQEKTPSFNVIPDKGIYHCFGCQAGGDVFKFLMTIEGLSFVEAVKELASAVGIEVEERELTPAERRALQQRATLFDVLEAAAKQYEAWLWTGAAGAAARAYLEQRGLGQATARAARLGWAPEGWTRIVDALHRQGFDVGLVAEAGLAKTKNEGESWYDVLRERLIVPIRDERGRVVAFGGRLLQGDGPKYMNTPETRLYQKSHVLYGLETARNPIQQRGRVIVVEGYFDVLSLQQAGFGETVATCGTALTKDHLEKIRRLARDVVLVMDADEAGLRAAERALPLFVDAGIQPWRLDLPGAKDPDELVRQEGPEAFERALQQKEPLFEWVVQRKLDAHGPSSMSRERALEEVAPLLARMHDPMLTSRVARRVGMPEEVVLERVRAVASKLAAPPAVESAVPPSPPAWSPPRDVVHLLWLLVHRYAEVADVLSRVDPELLADAAPVRPVFARLVTGEPVAAVLPDVTEPKVRQTLQAVVARPKLYEPEEAVRATLQILARMTAPIRTATLSAIKNEIDRAAARGDLEALRRATVSKQRLHDAERSLERAIRTGEVELALRCLSPPDRPE